MDSPVPGLPLAPSLKLGLEPRRGKRESRNRTISWIDLFGNPVKSANEMTADHKKARLVEEGEAGGKLTGWIRDKVSIAPYFRHFKGDFKGSSYDSGRPPAKTFKNNTSCKPFNQFVQKTLIDRVKCGATTIVGKVGVAYPPHIVLPLTVEPTKPRLCHDARYIHPSMDV